MMVRLALVYIPAGLVAWALIALPLALVFQSKELSFVVGMFCGGLAGPAALLVSPRLRGWTLG